MQRDLLIRQVRQRLAGRQLVYFGTRGFDAEGVADLPELSAVFSIVGRNDRRATVASSSLEEITGRRVDLDAHDIDDELGDIATVQLRRLLMRALARDSVVFTYRPSTFLSSICFARSDRVTYAGLFKDHQSAFEHKPWVESSLRARGVPAIPWVYIADEEQIDGERLLADGPVMVRRNRSSGGTGLVRVSSASDMRLLWPEQAESFASVAPYLADGIPTNVGAVVWDDGVTLHPPSVQLIGIPQLTERPFGYCGNDFAAARDIDPVVVAQMESTVRTVGSWLGARGFRGAFGVDFLVVGDTALFTEVNPRLQGVTHLSCQLSAERQESCILLEHVAALLDIRAPTSRPLADQAKDSPALAHFVFHQGERGGRDVDGMAAGASEWPTLLRLDMQPSPGLLVDPGATVLRTTIGEQVTGSGLALLPKWQLELARLASPACPEPTP